MRSEGSAAAAERPTAITVVAVLSIVLAAADWFFEAFILFRPETAFIRSIVEWYGRVADVTYLQPDAATLAFTTMNVCWAVPIGVLSGIGLLGMRRWGLHLGIANFALINYANTYDFMVDYWDGFARIKSHAIVLGIGMIEFTIFSFVLLYYLLKYQHLFCGPADSRRLRHAV